MDEILERRRRLVVNLLHAAGCVTVTALWVFEAWTGLLADLDRYAYPALLGTLGVVAVVGRVSPRHRAAVELGAYVIFAGYFIASIISFLILQPDNRIYTVANTLQWMPVIYLAAFFFFPWQLAMVASWSVFTLALLAPLVTLLAGDPASLGEVLSALLINAYMVHLLTLACLSLLALFGTQYEHARRQARALESAALTDPLTGVANRRGLERALERLDRTPGRAVGLILLDTDHFKAVNDRFGHLVGDEVLASLGQRLSARLRRGDIFGRWGGEEFLLIMPDTTQATALGIADRMRTIAREVPHPVVGTITMSAGVVVWMTGTPLQEALHRADMALYAAKAQGRNRVEAG